MLLKLRKNPQTWKNEDLCRKNNFFLLMEIYTDFGCLTKNVGKLLETLSTKHLVRNGHHLQEFYLSVYLKHKKSIQVSSEITPFLIKALWHNLLAREETMNEK